MMFRDYFCLLHSGITLGGVQCSVDHMRYQRLNPDYLQAKQVPYLLYYLSGPKARILTAHSLDLSPDFPLPGFMTFFLSIMVSSHMVITFSPVLKIS